MTKKKYFLLLLVFLFIPGCKEEDEITSNSHFSNALIGNWELQNDKYDQWKYFLIPSKDFYSRLSGTADNRHYLSSYLYTITDNQIILGGSEIYLFEINTDTLTLSEPGKTRVFLRSNNAPSEDEWVIPVNVLKDVPLIDFYGTDMAFDGSSFWLTFNDTVIVADTLGNQLKKYVIENSGGIAYANNKLWIANFDSIKIINPLNGEFISGIKMQEHPPMPIRGLSYENGYLWAVESNGIIYKVNEVTGEVVHKFYFPDAYEIEFSNGKIWSAADYYIYSIDPVTGKAIDTYIIKDNQLGYTSIVFDGNSFWIGYNSIPYYILSKVDMK